MPTHTPSVSARRGLRRRRSAGKRLSHGFSAPFRHDSLYQNRGDHHYYGSYRSYHHIHTASSAAPYGNNSYRHDYSEKRSLPITIPNYQRVHVEGERFVAFNIHMAGRHLGSRRYSEFVRLDTLLREEFHDFQFPSLPSKWPFKMSEVKLDARRRGLEHYLEKVCAVKVIADCDAVQEFLMEDTGGGHLPSVEVSLRVLLYADKSIMLSVKRNADSVQVYRSVVQQLGVSPEAARYCALFEMVDGSFERKLHDGECPHSIYIQNYSSAASSCIVLRKWCFDVEMEKVLCERDEIFQRMCYYQVEVGESFQNSQNNSRRSPTSTVALSPSPSGSTS